MFFVIFVRMLAETPQTQTQTELKHDNNNNNNTNEQTSDGFNLFAKILFPICVTLLAAIPFSHFFYVQT